MRKQETQIYEVISLHISNLFEFLFQKKCRQSFINKNQKPAEFVEEEEEEEEEEDEEKKEVETE